jgi:hypothetical protein
MEEAAAMAMSISTVPQMQSLVYIGKSKIIERVIWRLFHYIVPVDDGMQNIGG